MKHIDTSVITELLSKDRKDYYDDKIFTPNKENFQDHVVQKLDFENWESNAVLGLDIYQYSKMDEIPQSLIPLVFELIYDEAVRQCLIMEPTIFYSCNPDLFSSQFISTGDGGFQILTNPLQAILFAMWFQNILNLFNTFHFYPNLRSLLGSLTIRYCLTYDHVYRYKNNYYGRAIISNARIMSMDKLNRFLLEEHAMQWFGKILNGIETLRITKISDIVRKLNIPSDIKIESELFKDTDSTVHLSQTIAIPIIIAQKIGKMSPKGDTLSTYNLYLQYIAGFSDESNYEKGSNFVISLGNINSSDLLV